MAAFTPALFILTLAVLSTGSYGGKCTSSSQLTATGSWQEVTSPRNDDAEDADDVIICWDITAQDSDMVVLMEITNMDTRPPICYCEKLQIFDDQGPLDEHCAQSSFTVKSRGPTLYVQCTTSHTTRHKDVRLRFRQAFPTAAKGSQLPTGSVTGIVLGILIVICGCLGIGYTHRRRRGGHSASQTPAPTTPAVPQVSDTTRRDDIALVSLIDVDPHAGVFPPPPYPGLRRADSVRFPLDALHLTGPCPQPPGEGKPSSPPPVQSQTSSWDDPPPPYSLVNQCDVSAGNRPLAEAPEDSARGASAILGADVTAGSAQASDSV